LSFLANNDLQFDILGGYSNNGMDLSEWFVSAGLSWRMRGVKRVHKNRELPRNMN